MDGQADHKTAGTPKIKAGTDLMLVRRSVLENQRASVSRIIIYGDSDALEARRRTRILFVVRIQYLWYVAGTVSRLLAVSA